MYKQIDKLTRTMLVIVGTFGLGYVAFTHGEVVQAILLGIIGTVMLWDGVRKHV